MHHVDSTRAGEAPPTRACYLVICFFQELTVHASEGLFFLFFPNYTKIKPCKTAFGVSFIPKPDRARCSNPATALHPGRVMSCSHECCDCLLLSFSPPPTTRDSALHDEKTIHNLNVLRSDSFLPLPLTHSLASRRIRRLCPRLSTPSRPTPWNVTLPATMTWFSISNSAASATR